MNTYLRELTVQFAKFGIVGVIAFCIDYGLFLLMTYVFGINYLIASAISFVISTIFNFAASSGTCSRASAARRDRSNSSSSSC